LLLDVSNCAPAFSICAFVTSCEGNDYHGNGTAINEDQSFNL